MSSKERAFAQLLLEVVDDAFSVLGEAPKRALYQYLSTVHSLEREEIPDRTKDFSDGLRKALGGASFVIQKVILRKLFQRLGHTFKESQGLGFSDYVTDAMQRFEASMNRYVQHESFEIGRSKKRQVSG